VADAANDASLAEEADDDSGIIDKMAAVEAAVAEAAADAAVAEAAVVAAAAVEAAEAEALAARAAATEAEPMETEDGADGVEHTVGVAIGTELLLSGVVSAQGAAWEDTPRHQPKLKSLPPLRKQLFGRAARLRLHKPSTRS